MGEENRSSTKALPELQAAELGRAKGWGKTGQAEEGEGGKGGEVSVIGRLIGIVIVLVAAYAAYYFLFGRGWLATSGCLFVWFLLASLYKR